jgi:hypothetical protein
MSCVSRPDGAQIFHKDSGHGPPVIFSHGWPLNAMIRYQDRWAVATGASSGLGRGLDARVADRGTSLVLNGRNEARLHDAADQIRRAAPVKVHPMPISHTAKLTLNEPSDEIDLGTWIFGLSDEDYQACAKGHHGAGVYTDEQARGMVNVESVGGHLIVQHYREVHADRSSVEMYSATSRVYLFHLVPVAAAVRWRLAVAARTPAASEFTCTVDVTLPAPLQVVARLAFLGRFLRQHVEEEALGFAADISRKLHRAARSS